MIKPSVVVIGAGAVGLSAALQLAELGAGDIRVLEREHVAAGSSGRSVGIIETQYIDPLDIELRIRSMEYFDMLERAHHLRITRNGYLRLAHHPDQLGAFEQSVTLQQALGSVDARVLDAGEVRRLVPDIRHDDVVGGLFGPSDGYIDGYLYCSLLAQLASVHGVRVLTQAAVVGEESGSFHRHRLVTTNGNLESDFVVNAAGAWAGEVGSMLGTQVIILPQRHQAAVAHLPGPLPYVMPSVMDYIPHSGGYGLYFRHDTLSQLIVGLHTEEPLHDIVDPNNFNGSIDQAFVEAVAERLASRLPTLAEARIARGWAGLYPVSPDGFPQVGPNHGRETVISACGVGGFGLQVSPAIGRLVAEWILFGAPRSISRAIHLIPSRASLVR